MKTFLTFFLFSIICSNSFANTNDSTRLVNVGDSVKIKICPQKGYQHIQYFRKTRFTNINATYDKVTGDDFYEFFFLEGDFDAKELPCSFGDKKYKILSFKTFMDKTTGADRPVMFLELGPNTVAWVELNGAVANLEIYLE